MFERHNVVLLKGGGAEPLDSGASLQVLLDLGRVLAVEPLGFLVELGVPLVDVVDVGVVVVGPASAVLGALLDPANGKRRVVLMFDGRMNLNTALKKKPH